MKRRDTEKTGRDELEQCSLSRGEEETERTGRDMMGQCRLSRGVEGEKLREPEGTRWGSVG